MNRRAVFSLQPILACALSAMAVATAHATPVNNSIRLTATSGSQFGVTAPATLTGTFTVDSTFLAQEDGSYPGGAITNFLLVIGTQTFDQNTAFSPNIQGITLVNHKITGLGMNWSQTVDLLQGPYMQMSNGGAWESASTNNQAGTAILRGGDGTQNFLPIKLFDVDGDGSVDALSDGIILLRYLLGLRGSAMTVGAIGAGARRTPAEIETYIQSKM